MNHAPAVPSAMASPARRPRRRLGHRIMTAVAVAACAFMLLLNLFRREGYTGDEGFYGVVARNMLEAPDYVLRPSYFPRGDFAADRDGFAHPPFNSYFYALALWAAHGSVAGPEVLNVLAFAALLFLVYRIVAPFDRTAAQFAVLALAASGPMVGYFSMLEAEPLMTVFGLAAVSCALRARWRAPAAASVDRGGREEARRRRFALPVFLAGGCLGLAFALKLWLCGPLGLATVAALGGRAWQDRAPGREVAAGAVLFGAGFVLPAGVHLLAIAAVHPADLAFWLHNIYFGIFTHAGISGAKLAGDATPAAWVHPAWYYAAALYRDHFFLVPPIVFGVVSLGHDRRLRGRLLAVIVAGLAGLVPLSLMKVKEPLYVLSCAVFLYVLAGACLAALGRRFSSRRGVDRLSLWLGGTASVGLMVLFPLARARGIQPEKITSTFVMAHTFVFGVFCWAVAWAQRHRAPHVFAWTVYAVGAAAVVTVAASNAVTRVPRDPTLSRLVKPFLEHVPPGVLAMVASNFKGYQYYLFHRGVYWHDLPEPAAPDEVLAKPEYASLRVFVLSPEDEQRPRLQVWMKWLERHTVEKTEELDRNLGRVSGYRVFVRTAAAP